MVHGAITAYTYIFSVDYGKPPQNVDLFAEYETTKGLKY